MTTDVPTLRARRTTTARERERRADPRVQGRRAASISTRKGKLVDVRSPDEYTGKKPHMPEYPQEGALRGGHIPGARERAVGARREHRRLVQVRRRAARRSTRRSRARAERRRDRLLPHRRALVAHLVRAHYLLGYDKVRNYDGCWTEWGNAVRAPIERWPRRPTTPR